MAGRGRVDEGKRGRGGESESEQEDRGGEGWGSQRRYASQEDEKSPERGRRVW